MTTPRASLCTAIKWLLLEMSAAGTSECSVAEALIMRGRLSVRRFSAARGVHILRLPLAVFFLCRETCNKRTNSRGWEARN